VIGKAAYIVPTIAPISESSRVFVR